MAVLAPIPRMSARRATEVKPAFLTSSRRPKRTLRAKFGMLPSPKLTRYRLLILRRSVGRLVPAGSLEYAWGKKKFRQVSRDLGAGDSSGVSKVAGDDRGISDF